MPQLQDNKRYSYEEWLSWDEAVRSELVDGELYMMAPPSQRHQEVSGEIYHQLKSFLKGKPCKPFIAPFGVRLNKNEDTVFEPDIAVVCDRSKLDGKICNGAPDLVVEVLSPSSSRHDRITKLNKYQQAGVREYWIVDPVDNSLLVMVFEVGAVKGYADTDSAPVTVLPGCKINLQDVFAEV